MKDKTIKVGLKSGMTAIWETAKGEWDDYMYIDGLFVIKKDGAWVGVYNMDIVGSVIVE